MQTMIGRWKNRPVMSYRTENDAAVLERMKIIRALLERAEELEKMIDLDCRTQQTARTYAEAAYSIVCRHIKTIPRDGMYAATASDIFQRIKKTPLLTAELKKWACTPVKMRGSFDPCKNCQHRTDEYCEAAGTTCKEALHTRGCDAPPEILPPKERKI